MKLSIDVSLSIVKKDTVIIFVDENFEYRHIPSKLSYIRTAGDERFFKELTKNIYLPSTVNADVIIAPLSKSGEQSYIYRKAAADAVRTAQSSKKENIKIVIPDASDEEKTQLATWIAEGAMLGAYQFQKYKTGGDSTSITVKELVLLNIHSQFQEKLSRIEITGTCVSECRDMVNDITECVNPDTIEKEAKKIASLKNVSIKVMNERQLKSKGMNLILAVGKGAVYRPRLVILSYKGNSESKEWTALVGKGVTFDSGGLNIKPSASITDMRQDMGGAAAVLFTLKAAARLGVKKNIYGVLPLVENAVDSHSYKPGDIFTSFSGKTVQILNTDAEGRLILADALSYTEKILRPREIIDFATLTGACLVTFGWEYAALLSNSDELAEKLNAASQFTGEKIWRLPFDSAYDTKIKGDLADLTNISSDRKAGTIIGGTFLKQFVESTPFAHIDIAGTGWMDQANGIYGKYATGFGVRLLMSYFQNLP